MGKRGTHQSRNTVFSTNCEISLFWHIQVVGWTQPCIPYQKDNLCILLTRERCGTVWDDMSFFPHCLVKSITLDEVIIFFPFQELLTFLFIVWNADQENQQMTVLTQLLLWHFPVYWLDWLFIIPQIAHSHQAVIMKEFDCFAAQQDLCFEILFFPLF